MKSLSKKQIISVIFILAIVIAIPVALYLAGNRQELRRKAAGTTMTLSVLPTTETLTVNGTRTFELKATFAGGSSGEHLGYFKTEVNFSTIYLQMPDAQYVDTSMSGFNNIMRVDGPTAANQSGKIVIELAANAPGTGPATNQVLTVARFTLKGNQNTPSSQQLTLTSTQVLTNATTPANIPTTPQSANYTVSGSTSITPTPGSLTCLTLPQSDNFDTGPNPGPLWDVWSNNGVVTVGGTLNGNVAGGNGYVGVLTKNKVCGDFDMRVDFSGFTTSGQSEGDVRLSMEAPGNTDTNTTSIFIEKYSKGNEQGFSSQVVINNNPQTTNPVTSAVTSGKLRIRRVGNVISTYYDMNDGSGWHLLGNFASGYSGDVQPALIVKSWTQNPSVSANFDNFNLTTAILDPSITSVPPTPTLSPVPTPPSGRDRYIIDVGGKQSLVLNIGAAIAPQIKFKAKLASMRSYPDMYLKLRVKDELAFMDKQNNANAAVSNCNNPVAPDRDFYVPVKANAEGVYSPVQQITSPAPSGVQVAVVSGDGWVMLDGMVPGRYYTLYLKGPKTRKGKMVEHFLLQPNQAGTQDYDWTGKPLDPGDLPDPNNSNQQDCTINSTDWSLVKSRIGSNKTDQPALDVADVNYTGDVNALDSIAILETLAKRPDDDQ